MIGLDFMAGTSGHLRWLRFDRQVDLVAEFFDEVILVGLGLAGGVLVVVIVQLFQHLGFLHLSDKSRAHDPFIMGPLPRLLLEGLHALFGLAAPLGFGVVLLTILFVFEGVHGKDDWCVWSFFVKF